MWQGSLRGQKERGRGFFKKYYTDGHELPPLSLRLSPSVLTYLLTYSLFQSKQAYYISSPLSAFQWHKPILFCSLFLTLFYYACHAVNTCLSLTECFKCGQDGSDEWVTDRFTRKSKIKQMTLTPAAVTVECGPSGDRNVRCQKSFSLCGTGHWDWAGHPIYPWNEAHWWENSIHPFIQQQTQSLGNQERFPFSACAVFNDLLICETWPQHKALRGETGKCITIQYIDLDAAQTFEQR